MAYTKQTWADGPGGGTPISAARLNRLENGVAAAAAVADMTDVNSATGAAVGAASVGAVQASGKFAVILTPQQYGAKADGVNDDTAAINAAFSTAAQAVVASGMTSPGVVVWPAGHYKITGTIIQPPYVKAVAAGTAIIESYCTNATAWWVAPLATDPSNLYAPLLKQQWMRGSVIDGSSGGFLLINRNTSTGSDVGLELGSRSQLGAGRHMARYTLNDIAIQGYHYGIQWNNRDHYIAHYYRLHIEQNDTPVHIGNGTGQANSGENINFVDSVIGTNLGAGAAFQFDTDAIDVTLTGCSVDFVNTAFLFNYGWNRVLMQGGHLEGINEGGRATATGGIAVSNVASETFPSVAIRGVTPIVVKERGTLFRGNLRLWLEAAYRYSGLFADLTASNDVLCDAAVQLRSCSLTYNSAAPVPARALNSNRDPILAAEVAGTAAASLTYWTPSAVTNATGTVVAGGPRTGANSIGIIITGSGNMRLAAKQYVPVRPGNELWLTLAYSFPGTGPLPSLTCRATFYDVDKVVIGVAIDSTMSQGARTADVWMVPKAPARYLVPSGAAFARVEYLIGTGSGDGTTRYLLSEFSSAVV